MYDERQGYAAENIQRRSERVNKENISIFVPQNLLFGRDRVEFHPFRLSLVTIRGIDNPLEYSKTIVKYIQ